MPNRADLSKLALTQEEKELRIQRLTEMEDRIYERSAGIIEAFLSFHEVAPDQVEPPKGWIDEYGIEGALQKLLVAKAGWLPPSQAPSTFKLATQVFTAITRGRGGNGRVVANQVNVKIALPPPTTREHPGQQVYEVKDLE